MARLILIKHASPVKVETLTPHDWPLSDEGRVAAARLTARLQTHAISRIVTSLEPKASQTAQIVADAFGVAVETHEDLGEHRRENVPVMRTGDFISAMAQFFKERNRLVLGDETAAAAESRIESAIDEIVHGAPEGQTIAVVSHGTVIALYLAKLARANGFDVWRQMGLPSYAMIENNRVIERVNRIG